MNSFDVIEDRAAERTAVVVLGTGSSAAAAGDLFADLGCDAAISGDHENGKIAELNKAILASSGIAANDWSIFNRGWLSSPKATEFSKRALDVYRADFGGSYLAVMQEPSTARLLPFWNSVLDRAGVVPRFVFVISDPAEVAERLYEQSGIERRAGHLVWLRTMLDAEASSRGSARAFLASAELENDPAGSLEAISKKLKLTFPRDIKTVLASRRSHPAGESARRHGVGSTSGQRGPVPADWVTSAHETLKKWAVSGETAAGRLALDSIRGAFDEAIAAFPGIVDSVEGDRRRLADDPTDVRRGVSAGLSASLGLQVSGAERVSALEEAEDALRARYSEIVTLTRMLAVESASAQKSARNAERLGAIALAFDRGAARKGPAGLLDWIVPWRWRWNQIRQTVEREGLFDSEAYLRANADVKEAGADPLHHYLAHGAVEGRPLGRD